MPLGFDLSPFTVDDGERAARAASCVRSELGIPPTSELVTLIARLVPIKRVDRFLRVARGRGVRADVRFLIVGDGELREAAAQLARGPALGDRLVWAGFRRDMPAMSASPATWSCRPPTTRERR